MSLVKRTCAEDDLGIYLTNCRYTRRICWPLIQQIVFRPCVVCYIYLGGNNLEDIEGRAISEFVAKSTTIQELDLSGNQLGGGTYRALARALKVNSSLRSLIMYGNRTVVKRCIDKAFVEALWINTNRPVWTLWQLYERKWGDEDYHRLRRRARKIGYHPSLQMLLVDRC